MPSSPKNKKRRRADFYPTPHWATRTLLNSFPLIGRNKMLRIKEVCAGRGNISKVIKEFYPDCELTQHELFRNKQLPQYGECIFGDFFKTSTEDLTLDYVITNPPFSLAQEFIERCRELYPNAEIIMLLPFSFLGSAKRYDFWLKNTPNKFSILSDRPSFSNDGKTDSSVYNWTHWFNDDNRHIFLPPTFLKRP
jgi:hypothetical protein